LGGESLFRYRDEEKEREIGEGMGGSPAW